MIDTDELLANIRLRPALSFGVEGHVFSAFLGFLSGVGMAEECIKRGTIDQLHTLVPKNFSQFVAAQYGEGDSPSDLGWSHYIKTHSTSEQEAFDLFISLRAKCLRELAIKAAEPSHL
jgi:hypothetical protein